MIEIISYVLASVIIVSVMSFIGVFTISLKHISKIVMYFVSFSVGALFGDVFIHLLPEAFESGESLTIGIYILCGILFSFAIEKFIHWRHCHLGEGNHKHTFAYMNLVGDSVHNFIDGIIIAGAYLVNIPVGIATTVAIILHEIPQEIGDFGVLIHGGFSKAKALFFNFMTALTSVGGAILGLILGSAESTLSFLIPFAAGNLIYIAGTDLIPELHKESCEVFDIKRSLLQLLFIILGIGVMISLGFLE